MTVHGDARTSLTRVITKIKNREDARIKRRGSLYIRKRKKLSAEDMTAIAVFDAKHGIHKRHSLVPGVSLRSKKTKRQVTLPKLNLPEDQDA